MQILYLTLGAHQARVSQQYISYLLLVNHIITPRYQSAGFFKSICTVKATVLAATSILYGERRIYM